MQLTTQERENLIEGLRVIVRQGEKRVNELLEEQSEHENEEL